MSSNSIKEIYYSCNNRVYTKSSSGNNCNISFSWNQIAYLFVFHKQNINDASLTLQRKKYQFKVQNVQITLQINQYVCI